MHTTVHRLITSGRARELRVAARLSLDSAGELCGVTGDAVRKWEQGVRYPVTRHVPAYWRLLSRLEAAGEEASA